MGGAAIAVVCSIPFAFNLYTEQHAPVAIPMAQAHLIVAPSPVQMAAARFAADVSCLAEVMYYEARGEGVAGQKAVAEVVLQRTKDRNFPHTICGVVHEGVQIGRRDCQFSFACDGSANKPRERTSWRQVRLLAENIVAGTVKLANQTGHAVAFHNAGVSPVWADTMLKTAQIGNHVFYRWAPRVHAPAAAEAGSQTASSGSLETSISVAVKDQTANDTSSGI
jgi:spore germination cell wall hydrolase CwlJ-like protein